MVSELSKEVKGLWFTGLLCVVLLATEAIKYENFSYHFLLLLSKSVNFWLPFTQETFLCELNKVKYKKEKPKKKRTI